MANDNWRTPKEVFNTLDKEFNFLADMACTERNSLCALGFTEKHDSLSFPWLNRLYSHYGVSVVGKRSYVWLNCPYSNVSPWLDQVIEAQKYGLGTVMLLNNDMSVGWFHKLLPYVSEIRNIIADQKPNGKYESGRIAFLDENGNPSSGNNKAQFILVFNPFKIGAAVTSYINKSSLYE